MLWESKEKKVSRSPPNSVNAAGRNWILSNSILAFRLIWCEIDCKATMMMEEVEEAGCV